MSAAAGNSFAPSHPQPQRRHPPSLRPTRPASPARGKRRETPERRSAPQAGGCCQQMSLPAAAPHDTSYPCFFLSAASFQLPDRASRRGSRLNTLSYENIHEYLDGLLPELGERPAGSRRGHRDPHGLRSESHGGQHRALRRSAVGEEPAPAGSHARRRAVGRGEEDGPCVLCARWPLRLRLHRDAVPGGLLGINFAQ